MTATRWSVMATAITATNHNNDGNQACSHRCLGCSRPLPLKNLLTPFLQVSKYSSQVCA